MNTTTLRYNPDSDSLISQWARIATVGTRSFTGRRFPADRLKAFATRFQPSRESWTQRIAGVGLTLGAYAGAVIAARGLSTLDVSQLMHALHLSGV
jgi:hypothetical protein